VDYKEAKKEDIKIAYAELIEELNNDLLKEKENLKRTEIDRIKIRISQESFSSSNESKEKLRVLNLSKESELEFPNKCEQVENKIKELERRLEYLKMNKESILNNK